jgi:hypothetical protein
MRTLILVALIWATPSLGQSLSSSAGTAVSQAPGDRAWGTPTNAQGNPDGAVTSAGVLNPGRPSTESLILTNFNFSTLPTSITVLGIVATVTRMSTNANAVQDVTIQLVKGGVIQTAANRANATAWPGALTAVNYGNSTDLWNNSWTRADLVAGNFGIEISAARNLSNTRAEVDAVSITIYYSVTTPITLTSFDVQKSNDGASIRFTTASEENVRVFNVQRSADGRHFEDRIAVVPAGGLNLQSRYAVNDPTPLPGISYYRLKEVDLDGRVFYFETRRFEGTGSSEWLKVQYGNGAIQVVINAPEGSYLLRVIDQSGGTVQAENLQVAPSGIRLQIGDKLGQQGIYFVNLRGGNGVNLTKRVYLQR